MGINNNITFSSTLKKLGISQDISTGFRLVSQRLNEKDPDLFLALEQACKFGATAVYFRFYNDYRPPKPQIYIYDKSQLNHGENEEADIHHKLWNAGIVPFCFIYKASQILVFNCGKQPKWDSIGENFITSPHDTIDLLNDIQHNLDVYNVRQFDSGLFWDSKTGKSFKYEEGAYEQLLAQIKNVKSVIISRVGEKHASLVKRILMMLILIKYLEERKDDEGISALNPEEFYKAYNPQNPTLEGVLKDAELFSLVLKELASKEHFNGQIFHLNEGEIKTLRSIDLSLFRYFVKGDVSIFPQGNQGIGQMSLWRLYQFNYLPIELISHIYEDFLADKNGQKKKGVVYTPPYLVQFLIDQCMPLKDPKEDFKILDPACGSGIFLVGAFKRMIQWWRLKNNWEKPGKEHISELKSLLNNNIFGCDLEDEAVILSYFSLGLALLDSLSPKEIWRNVHFDNLVGKNLFQGDFFKTLRENKLADNFQLIIGNPPFASEFTDEAAAIDKIEKEDNPERPDIPDNQISLLFLEQSFKLLKEGAKCCLILPSGPVLYNTKTHDFRKYLFKRYYISGIYDFTPLRAKLFIGSSSNAKPAVVSVFAEKSAPEKRPCFHYIFRRTKASGEKIDFEIDHYDIHKVSHNVAAKNPAVWQSNFMGGGRLHQLLEKISDIPTLGDYLNEKIESSGWKVAEGWIESPDSKDIQRVKFLSEKENRTNSENVEFKKLEESLKADWITGSNFVETKNFTEDGILSIDNCKIKYFLRNRNKNKEIFQPPHLLIKESVTGSKIPVYYSDSYLTFKDQIFGIYAPQKYSDELRRIEILLNSKESLPLIWLSSAKVITSREGVPNKIDILSIPHSKLNFDEIEKILLKDIVDYYSDFRKSGEKSIVLEPTKSSELIVFGELYCRILNSIYGDFRPLAPIVGKEFVAYPFVLGDKPEIEIPTSIEAIESQLKGLITTKQGYNLWIQRIVKVYHKNVIFLYKPNQKRYWLPSVAVRDADETFVDLHKQGK